jgi:hypothetical protein
MVRIHIFERESDAGLAFWYMGQERVGSEHESKHLAEDLSPHSPEGCFQSSSLNMVH